MVTTDTERPPGIDMVVNHTPQTHHQSALMTDQQGKTCSGETEPLAALTTLRTQRQYESVHLSAHQGSLMDYRCQLPRANKEVQSNCLSRSEWELQEQSDGQEKKHTVSPPPLTLPLSHALPKLLGAGALLSELLSHSPRVHVDSDMDKRSIRRKKYRRRRRRRRRRTTPDLKKQQLRQTHCHSNICFMLSAAAGQFTAWEPQN
ncbi:unnamed protein product [Pleuronectes platessa]|uniref:Uncharacterized protein n=1 Tax=Pleuronectes platessa TaxID=8262 RepID=A0A9N7VM15_PLEPL|nr:unnamed protein product [Pleuronectes platessa]